MKRIFDLLLAIMILFPLVVPMLLITISVRLSFRGPALYWSDRIGKGNNNFKIPKFRSMLIDTPTLATHLINNPHSYLSPIGGFLRLTSLDELPQLFSIIKGDMSFVGPRPALFNQVALIALRTDLGVSKLLPGVTGWAQINGRDQLSIDEKVNLDLVYLNRQSFWFDLIILIKTAIKVIKNKDVTH